MGTKSSMLAKLITERDYVGCQLITSQMEGRAGSEAYWQMWFDKITDQIDTLCRDLGLPVVHRSQLPLFVFIDGEVTKVTFEE